jgi:general secretion pathway protein G
LDWVEPGRLLSVAAYIGKEPWLLKLMQKMVRLGLEAQNAESASSTAAQAQIASFKTALDAFEVDNGYFPKGRDGLMALVQKPREAAHWHGPYLALLLKDPWNQDYIYECPGKHNPGSYDISSPGQPGDELPIGNWATDKHNRAQVKDLDDLMAKMLPVAVAGSMDLKDKLTFAFSYRFPAANVAETYAQLKQFMTNGFQAFVGKHKMYAAASLAEKDHTINGVAVDRVSLTLNLDSLGLKMAGQKEQLLAFWPEGKMEFDYAVKGDRLLAGSADRMKELLEPGDGKSNRKAALKLEPGTSLAGYLNLLGFMKQVFAANPAIPEAVKGKMAKLDAEGVDLEFQLRLDNQMHAVVRVPLKLLGELGRLKDN